MNYPKDLVPKFFDKTASSYDRIAYFTTFGKDTFWKKIILEQIDSASTILDLACGTGILTRMLAEKFPNAKIVGVDISQNFLKIAEKNSKSFKNITYVNQDAEKLILETKFDCISSSYIPKYADAAILVKSCLNHLNPGGMVVLHDFTYPTNFQIQRLWNVYFVFLKFLGVFIPDWKYAFRELPNLIKTSKWVTNYTSEMTKNGFAVEKKSLTLDSSAILVGRLG